MPGVPSFQSGDQAFGPHRRLRRRAFGDPVDKGADIGPTIKADLGWDGPAGHNKSVGVSHSKPFADQMITPFQQAFKVVEPLG